MRHPHEPGSVGPFWIVEDGSQIVILALAVPLERADRYGDMLTVDTGHLHYWNQLARLGATALCNQGLPTAPVWSEYDEWPRGRVLYDTMAQHFLIRADQQLHRPAFIHLIAQRFGIAADVATILPDEHYQSVRRLAL